MAKGYNLYYYDSLEDYAQSPSQPLGRIVLKEVDDVCYGVSKRGAEQVEISIHSTDTKHLLKIPPCSEIPVLQLLAYCQKAAGLVVTEPQYDPDKRSKKGGNVANMKKAAMRFGDLKDMALVKDFAETQREGQLNRPWKQYYVALMAGTLFFFTGSSINNFNFGLGLIDWHKANRAAGRHPADDEKSVGFHKMRIGNIEPGFGYTGLPYSIAIHNKNERRLFIQLPNEEKYNEWLKHLERCVIRGMDPDNEYTRTICEQSVGDQILWEGEVRRLMPTDWLGSGMWVHLNHTMEMAESTYLQVDNREVVEASVGGVDAFRRGSSKEHTDTPAWRVSIHQIIGVHVYMEGRLDIHYVEDLHEKQMSQSESPDWHRRPMQAADGGFVLMLRVVDDSASAFALADAIYAAKLRLDNKDIQKWRCLMRPFIVTEGSQSEGWHPKIDTEMALAAMTSPYNYQPRLGASVASSLEGMRLCEDGYVVPCTVDADHLCQGLIDHYDAVRFRVVWEIQGEAGQGHCYEEILSPEARESQQEAPGVESDTVPSEEASIPHDFKEEITHLATDLISTLSDHHSEVLVGEHTYKYKTLSEEEIKPRNGSVWLNFQPGSSSDIIENGWIWDKDQQDTDIYGAAIEPGWVWVDLLGVADVGRRGGYSQWLSEWLAKPKVVRSKAEARSPARMRRLLKLEGRVGEETVSASDRALEEMWVEHEEGIARGETLVRSSKEAISVDPRWGKEPIASGLVALTAYVESPSFQYVGRGVGGHGGNAVPRPRAGSGLRAGY